MLYNSLRRHVWALLAFVAERGQGVSPQSGDPGSSPTVGGSNGASFLLTPSIGSGRAAGVRQRDALQPSQAPGPRRGKETQEKLRRTPSTPIKSWKMYGCRILFDPLAVKMHSPLALEVRPPCIPQQYPHAPPACGSDALSAVHWRWSSCSSALTLHPWRSASGKAAALSAATTQVNLAAAERR